MLEQLAGLLADCTEEELTAFDSTLWHPPPEKSGVNRERHYSCPGSLTTKIMQSTTIATTKTREAKKLALRLQPFTKKEVERNRKMLDQLAGLLSDFSEEELAAFDSALRRPCPLEKSEQK